MKYCPTCETQYDEEILRFCTKDGSPLIDEDQPQFTELPSESLDDKGEETVIRRKPPVPQPDPDSEDFSDSGQNGQRIVIPTVQGEVQRVRPRTTTSPRDMPLPRESNTLVVVLLTIIGTTVVISAAFGVFWILAGQNSEANLNINTNFNAFDENLNLNANADNSLFNLNANENSNANLNLNFNTNINTRTPTPTPTLVPTPSPETNVNGNSSVNTATPTPRPSATPTPSISPAATPAKSPSGSPVNGGILNERAINLQTPTYPRIARENRASGIVQVQVLVDEQGNVNSAKAISGNPLLRSPAEIAARNSRFKPVKLDGRNVKTTGFVVYNFVAQN